MPQLKAAAYIFLVLIDFDSIAFHWLHRAGEIMAVWVSYQGVVYERGVCQLRETLMGTAIYPCSV